MVKMVEEDPFIPIAWQKNHKGMQGNEYINSNDEFYGRIFGEWIKGRNYAIEQAKKLNSLDVTKQLCNRLLEPFMWHTVLVTATEYENFFDLRCPKYHTPVSGEGFTFKSKKDCIANHSNPQNIEKLENYSLIDWLMINQSQAEIHIQALAEAMWDAYNESTPKQLKAGEWHIPFGDQIESNELHDYGIVELDNVYDIDYLKVAVAVARCARLSYMTFDNKIDYKKDMELTQTLFKNKHRSPFEHVARCMSDDEYYSFIKGRYPTGRDTMENIFNYEIYANVVEKESKWIGFSGENQNTKHLYGWCNNFRGFIPYRYLIEKIEKI